MKTAARILLAAAALAASAFPAAWAGDAAPQQVAAAPAATAGELTAGEVRKVDAAQGKITIKHEAIKNLDMGPMTMVFRASKPELLKNLKTGDKIRFRAESEKGGALVVTQIEAAK